MVHAGQVVAAAGAVLLAVGHALDPPHGHLVILGGLLPPAQVRVHGGQAAVSAAEVGVELDGPQILLDGLFVFPRKAELLSGRVAVGRLQRGRGVGFGGGELHRLRRGVAERLADRGGQFPHRGQHLLFAGGLQLPAGDLVAGHPVQRAHRNLVATAFPLDRAGHDGADALAHGDQARHRFIQAGGAGLQLGRDAQRLIAANRVDERSPLHGQREHRFERAVEDRVPGGVAEVGHDERNRLAGCCWLGQEAVPQKDGGDHHDEHQRAQPHRDPSPGLAGGRRRYQPRHRDHQRSARGIPGQRVQVPHHLGRALVTLVRVNGQALDHHCVERLRHGWIHLPGRRGRLLGALQQAGQHGVGLEGYLAGEHLVENDAQGKQVGPGIDPPALGLLRRHVSRRAHQHAGLRHAVHFHRPRQPEVHHRDPAAAVYHDVLRLEVAVNDALGMGRFQGAGHLPHYTEAFIVGGPSLLEQGSEVPPLDELHGDELEALGHAQVINADDVLVGDLAGQDQLLLEAREDLGIAGQFGADDLHRQQAVQLAVPGLVDRPHAAFPEHLENLITVGQQAARHKRRRSHRNHAGADHRPARRGFRNGRVSIGRQRGVALGAVEAS